MTRSDPEDCAESAGTLDIDISCTRCGYNLRSLAVDGQCPECSASVQASLNADRLMFADPNWLSGLVRGLTVILWSLGFWVSLCVCLSAAPIVSAGLGYAPLGVRTVVHEFEGDRAVGTYSVSQNIIAWIATPVCLTVMMLGVFLCTSNDESDVASKSGRRKRRASRVLAILCGLAALTPVFLFNQVATHVQKMPRGISVGPAMPNLSNFLVLALIVSISLVVPVFFLWLAHVAARIPAVRLVRWCRRLGSAYAILTIVTFAVRAIPASQSRVVGISLFPLVLIGFVANAVGIVVLLVVYRRTVRRLIPACLRLDECFVQDGSPCR